VNTTSLLIVGGWLLCVSSGFVAAQQSVTPRVAVTIEALVREPGGKPVEGATVNLGLPRYGEGQNDERNAGRTNADGVATVSGMAEQTFRVKVEKPGFYPTWGSREDVNVDPSGQGRAGDVRKLTFELRPVIDPVKQPIVRVIDRIRLPAFNKPLGFDLEVADWVTPFGRGKVADFVFTVSGRFGSLQDFDQTLALSFSKTGDGIQSRKYQSGIGPDFMFPYQAPSSGYESSRTWRTMFDGKSRIHDFDRSGEVNYIFRVRSELDQSGGVQRALHGIIEGEIQLGGNNVDGQNVSFSYRLNPDWTTNIEFGPLR